MDRLEFLKNKYSDVPSDIFDIAISQDPTNEKKYLDWILRLYKKLEIKHNDLTCVNVLLSQFERIKKILSPEFRDINKFSSLAQLYSLVVRAMAEEKTSIEQFLSNGAKKIYSDEKWLIVSPLTYEAALKYGQSTKWCTSSKDSSSHFYSYMASGRLFILINKTVSENDKNGKLQFHFANSEYRNALNNGIDIIDFFLSNLNLLTVFDNEKILKNTGLEILNAKNPTERMQLESASRFGIQSIIKFVKNPCKKLIEQAINENVNNVKYFDVNKDAVQNILLEVCEAKRIICKLFDIIIENNATPNIDVAATVLEDHPEHIKKIQSPTEEMICLAVIQNPSIIKLFPNISHKCKLDNAINNSNVLEHIDANEFNDKEVMQIIKSNAFENDDLIFINLSKKLQIKLIKKDPYIINYIKKPSNEAKKLAKKLFVKLNEKEKKTIEQKNAESNGGYNEIYGHYKRHNNRYDDGVWWDKYPYEVVVERRYDHNGDIFDVVINKSTGEYIRKYVPNIVDKWLKYNKL